MPILKRKKMRLPITSLFNAVLIMFIIIRATLSVMVQPINSTTNSYLSILLAGYPTTGFVAMLIIALAIIMWSAHLLQIFWNRFFADMFSLRDLEYQEALAIILMIAVIIP
ncbi:MAG: hypothetical protein Q8P11_01085 [bacterium]|nr:hypothetical protein [bacterium]